MNWLSFHWDLFFFFFFGQEELQQQVIIISCSYGNTNLVSCEMVKFFSLTICPVGFQVPKEWNKPTKYIYNTHIYCGKRMWDVPTGWMWMDEQTDRMKNIGAKKNKQTNKQTESEFCFMGFHRHRVTVSPFTWQSTRILPFLPFFPFPSLFFFFFWLTVTSTRPTNYTHTHETETISVTVTYCYIS